VTIRTPKLRVVAQDAPHGGCIVYGMTRVQLLFPIPTPLLTINTRRRMHWREQARLTREQRALVGLTLRAAQLDARGDLLIFPRMVGRVRVDVDVYPRTRMQRHDDSAIWEALKPTFDGVEDYGLVADDRQLTHGVLRWHAERSGVFVLTLTCEETDERAA